MRGPESVFPRHVRACQHSPDRRERWFVHTWKRSGGTKITRVPYSCNSWRCETCRRHEAAVLFARFKEAVQAVEARVEAGELPRAPDGGHGWCFLVTTLDRDGYFSGKPWHDVTHAYRSIGGMTRKLLDRIGREWGPETREEIRTIRKGPRAGQTVVRYVPTLGNRWAQVVEAHRSGWPHANIVIWCPELAALLRAESAARLEDPAIADAVALAREAWKRREAVPSNVRELAREATLAGGRVLEVLEASGWGRQSTAESARDIEAVIAYGVKLAGLHEASIGELAKITQCPMNAPERFRRSRTGKGFFPPRRSDPNVTGCMLRRRRSAEGDWELEAINAPTDKWEREQIAALRAEGQEISAEEERARCAAYLERQNEQIANARAAELQLIDEEERVLSRNRGRLPAMPPLRVSRAGVLEPHRVTSERRAALEVRQRAHAHPIGLSPVELEQLWREAAARRAAG